MLREYTLVAYLDKESTKILAPIMEDLATKYQNNRALRFMPHFTVRSSFKVDDNKLPDLLNDLKAAIKSLGVGTDLKLTEYEFVSWGALFINVAVTPDIYKLHESVMNVVEKYRDPWINPEMLENPAFVGRQKEYVLKYGYHFAFEFFKPHITLLGAKVSPDYHKEIKCLYDGKEFDMDLRPKIGYVTLLQSDEDGVKEVQSFALSNDH